MQRLAAREAQQKTADEVLLHSCPPHNLVQVPLWAHNLTPGVPHQLQGTLTVPSACSVRLLRRMFARAVQVHSPVTLCFAAEVKQQEQIHCPAKQLANQHDFQVKMGCSICRQFMCSSVAWCMLCAGLPCHADKSLLKPWPSSILADLPHASIRTMQSCAACILFVTKPMACDGSAISYACCVDCCSWLSSAWQRKMHAGMQIQPLCVQLSLLDGGPVLQDFVAGQEASIRQYGLEGSAAGKGLEVTLCLQEGSARVQALIQQEVDLVQQELLSTRLRSPAAANAAGWPPFACV